jgi:hypothetical protein
MLDVLSLLRDVADASRRSAAREQAAAAGQQRVFDQLDASLTAIERSLEILLRQQGAAVAKSPAVGRTKIARRL